MHRLPCFGKALPFAPLSLSHDQEKDVVSSPSGDTQNRTKVLALILLAETNPDQRATNHSQTPSEPSQGHQSRLPDHPEARTLRAYAAEVLLRSIDALGISIVTIR